MLNFRGVTGLKWQSPFPKRVVSGLACQCGAYLQAFNGTAEVWVFWGAGWWNRFFRSRVGDIGVPIWSNLWMFQFLDVLVTSPEDEGSDFVSTSQRLNFHVDISNLAPWLRVQGWHWRRGWRTHGWILDSRNFSSDVFQTNPARIWHHHPQRAIPNAQRWKEFRSCGTCWKKKVHVGNFQCRSWFTTLDSKGDGLQFLLRDCGGAEFGFHRNLRPVILRKDPPERLGWLFDCLAFLFNPWEATGWSCRWLSSVCKSYGLFHLYEIHNPTHQISL